MNKKKEDLRPFFANFLEGMDAENLDRVKGGITHKYPSDADEGPEPEM